MLLSPIEDSLYKHSTDILRATPKIAGVFFPGKSLSVNTYYVNRLLAWF